MLIPTRAPAGPKSVAECFSNRVTVCPHRCESRSWVSRGLSNLGEQPFLGSVLRRLACLSDPTQPCMFCVMKIPIVTGCSYFQYTTYTTCILGFSDIANFAWHQCVQILASNHLQASVVDLLLNVWYQVESKEATPKSFVLCRKTFTMMTSGSWKYFGIRELHLFKSGLRVLFFHSAFINGFLIFLRQFSIFFIFIDI